MVHEVVMVFKLLHFKVLTLVAVLSLVAWPTAARITILGRDARGTIFTRFAHFTNIWQSKSHSKT